MRMFTLSIGHTYMIKVIVLKLMGLQFLIAMIVVIYQYRDRSTQLSILWLILSSIVSLVTSTFNLVLNILSNRALLKLRSVFFKAVNHLELPPMLRLSSWTIRG